MNVETCRIICQKLTDRNMVATGMGFTTLAGKMGFSEEEFKEFEACDKPCESMLKAWSSRDARGNNVLKLMDLVKKMKRDDIVELLKAELEKVECHCRECAAA